MPGSVAFSQDSVNSSGWGVARCWSPVRPLQLSANVGVDMGFSGPRAYLVGTKALGLIYRTLKQTNKQTKTQ